MPFFEDSKPLHPNARLTLWRRLEKLEPLTIFSTVVLLYSLLLNYLLISDIQRSERELTNMLNALAIGSSVPRLSDSVRLVLSLPNVLPPGTIRYKIFEKWWDLAPPHVCPKLIKFQASTNPLQS
jgi:hypothetical protein